MMTDYDFMYILECGNSSFRLGFQSFGAIQYANTIFARHLNTLTAAWPSPSKNLASGKARVGGGGARGRPAGTKPAQGTVTRERITVPLY